MPDQEDQTLPPIRLTMSVLEAGEILGLGRSAAYEAARRNQIPVLRIGGRLLVPVAKLEEMVGALPGALSKAKSTERHIIRSDDP